MSASGNIPPDANANCVGPSSEEAGKASACAGCPNQTACASGKGGEKDPEIALVAERLSGIKHKVLVLSGKGGVGKSTVCAQLAWLLSSLKKHVGVLDVDICGPSIPRLFNVENEEIHKSSYGWTPIYVNDHLCVMSVGFMLNSRNDAVVWRGPRKNGLIRQFLTDVNWADVQFLLVDTPPGTSDEHISIVRYLEDSNIDGAIVVTTPQELSLLDVRKELSFCKKVGLKVIGVIENMSGLTCPNCACCFDVFPGQKDAVPKMCDEFGVRFLGRIPFETEIGKKCEEGASVFADNAKRGAVSEQARSTLMAAINALA